VTAAVFALVGCFSESDSDDDDNDNDATTGNSTDPTLTTTIDPSVTTSMTTTSMTTTSSDPTSETDPSVDSSGKTDSDTDPGTTTDPTEGGCPGQGDAMCNDEMAVQGELCFLAPESLDGGTEQIGDLAIGDIDGNGAPDVALTDGGDGFVAFTTDGVLQDAVPIAGAIATWSVAIAPLGQDGDIGVAFGAATAVVLVQRHNGATFTTVGDLPAPGEFVTVRSGNFDGDNLADLLVASEESGTIYLYPGTFEGTFGGYGELVTGVDGITDMRVLHDPDEPTPGIAILTRDGRLIWTPPSESLGNFTEIDPSQTYGDPTTAMLAAGDLDDDGDTDLAVAFDGRAFVFRAGALGYMPPQTLGEGASGDVTAAIADIDNDGLADVLLGEPLDDEIEVYIADGPNFSQAMSIQIPPAPRGLGVADFNADCAADIVALGPAWLDVVSSNP